MRPSTHLVRGPLDSGTDPWAATSPPLYQTATFAQESAVSFGAYDYTRTSNPTRDALEAQLGALEGEGARALAYSSGVAAIAATCRLVPAGGRIVAGRELYGGTQRLLEHGLAHDLRVDRVDVRNPLALEEALGPRSRAELVWIETPSNPRLEVADIAAVAARARAAGALLVVDNTMLSPWLQRPLDLGADLVVESCTKHLGGHSDVTAGVIATRDDVLFERLFARRNGEGTALAPFEAWLLLRGTRTLGVRLDRAQASALEVAQALAGHPAVRHVHYPGLEGHPDHALLARQATGAGSVVSFETGDPALARRVVEDTRLFSIAVSFGGVSSSISLPVHMSHASIPAGSRGAAIPGTDLVRLAIGLEDPRDLVADLEQALG